jgi:hypothetical protein
MNKSKTIKLLNELHEISAQAVLGNGFISHFSEDNPKSTPKSILRKAEKQDEIMKSWSVRISAIARNIQEEIEL